MFQFVQSLFSYVLAPPHCMHCDLLLTHHTAFCTSCFFHIQPAITTDILVKGNDVPVFALGIYQDPLTRLIRAKHYQNRAPSIQLGRLMAQQFCQQIKEMHYIIPVPLHWTRYARRGFNQAVEMASTISKQVGIGYCNPLMRQRKTAFQATLDKNDRKANVTNAFAIRSATYRPLLYDKDIVIVDDLMTTGATLVSVVKALLPVRPRSVKVIVAART